MAATHVEIIDYMNLTCFKNAQITRIPEEIAKTLPTHPNACVALSFSWKIPRRRRTLSDYPGIVSSLAKPS